MEDFKKPGHTYFAHKNSMLFNTVRSSVSLAAADFPVFPQGKSLLEAAMEGENAFKNVTDKLAIALTVKSEIPGHGVTGGTMILTEAEQDNLILGFLERRGKKASAALLARIEAELPEEGIVANSGAKSKFSPSTDDKLPGEEGVEDSLREHMKTRVFAMGGRGRGDIGVLLELLKQL